MVIIHQPMYISRHYHPNYTIIMLALVGYLRSLLVRALHRKRVGSIPAEGPIVEEFFSTVVGLNFDMYMTSTRAS